MIDSMEAALVALRLVQFTAAFLACGALLFRLYGTGGYRGAYAARARLDSWVRRLVLPSAVVAFVSAIAWLDIEAAIMGGGWAKAADGATLATVLLDTEFGRAWGWHLLFAAILVAATIPAGGKGEGRVLAACRALVAAALVASLAWAGHGLIASGGAGATHLATQVIHLLAGAMWLGGLPPLGFVLARAYRDGDGEWAALARHALPRFSLVGYGAVGALVVTGCLNSWFLVGSFGALIGTTYGQVLLVKICLFLLMVGVACLNRFGLTPAVTRKGATVTTAGRPLALLSRNVIFEQGIGFLVLAIVSVLGTLPPAAMG